MSYTYSRTLVCAVERWKKKFLTDECHVRLSATLMPRARNIRVRVTIGNPIKFKS